MKIEDNKLRKLFAERAPIRMPEQQQEELLQFIETAALKEKKKRAWIQNISIGLAITAMLTMLMLSVGKEMLAVCKSMFSSLNIVQKLSSSDVNPLFTIVLAIICFYLSLDLWLSKRKKEQEFKQLFED